MSTITIKTQSVNISKDKKEYTIKTSEDGTKEWFRNGKRHRTDGPAIDGPNKREWWVNGVQIGFLVKD